MIRRLPIGRHLPHHREGGVERPVDRHDPGAGGDGLEELAGGDPALRQDDHDLEPGGRAVRRRRGGGIARGGADDRPGAGLEGSRDGDDHPPVLERAGRVLALDLGVEVVESQLGAQAGEPDERGEPLAERECRRGVGERQEPPVALRQRGPGGVRGRPRKGTHRRIVRVRSGGTPSAVHQRPPGRSAPRRRFVDREDDRSSRGAGTSDERTGLGEREPGKVHREAAVDGDHAGDGAGQRGAVGAGDDREPAPVRRLGRRPKEA